MWLIDPSQFTSNNSSPSLTFKGSSSEEAKSVLTRIKPRRKLVSRKELKRREELSPSNSGDEYVSDGGSKKSTSSPSRLPKGSRGSRRVIHESDSDDQKPTRKSPALSRSHRSSPAQSKSSSLSPLDSYNNAQTSKNETLSIDSREEYAPNLQSEKSAVPTQLGRRIKSESDDELPEKSVGNLPVPSTAVKKKARKKSKWVYSDDEEQFSKLKVKEEERIKRGKANETLANIRPSRQWLSVNASSRRAKDKILTYNVDAQLDQQLQGVEAVEIARSVPGRSRTGSVKREKSQTSKQVSPSPVVTEASERPTRSTRKPVKTLTFLKTGKERRRRAAINYKEQTRRQPGEEYISEKASGPNSLPFIGYTGPRRPYKDLEELYRQVYGETKDETELDRKAKELSPGTHHQLEFYAGARKHILDNIQDFTKIALERDEESLRTQDVSSVPIDFSNLPTTTSSKPSSRKASVKLSSSPVLPPASMKSPEVVNATSPSLLPRNKTVVQEPVVKPKRSKPTKNSQAPTPLLMPQKPDSSQSIAFPGIVDLTEESDSGDLKPVKLEEAVTSKVLKRDRKARRTFERKSSSPESSPQHRHATISTPHKRHNNSRQGPVLSGGNLSSGVYPQPARPLINHQQFQSFGPDQSFQPGFQTQGSGTAPLPFPVSPSASYPTGFPPQHYPPQSVNRAGRYPFPLSSSSTTPIGPSGGGGLFPNPAGFSPQSFPDAMQGGLNFIPSREQAGLGQSPNFSAETSNSAEIHFHIQNYIQNMSLQRRQHPSSLQAPPPQMRMNPAAVSSSYPGVPMQIPTSTTPIDPRSMPTEIWPQYYAQHDPRSASFQPTSFQNAAPPSRPSVPRMPYPPFDNSKHGPWDQQGRGNSSGQ